MKVWEPPPCLSGPVYQSVCANWTYWTYSWLLVCSQESLHYIQSATKKRHLSRMYEPEMKAWPGIQALWSTPPSFSLHPQTSTHSFHPSSSLPCPPLHPPTPNWLWKMASVSHLGTKIKGKLQPTSMQNVIWKPPSYVLTIDFLTQSLFPHFSASFLSKHNTMQCEI